MIQWNLSRYWTYSLLKHGYTSHGVVFSRAQKMKQQRVHDDEDAAVACHVAEYKNTMCDVNVALDAQCKATITLQQQHLLSISDDSFTCDQLGYI